MRRFCYWVLFSKRHQKHYLSEKIPCFWANGQTSPARQGERSAENRNGFPVFRRLAVRVRARLVGGFDRLFTDRRQNRGGKLTGTDKGLFKVLGQPPQKILIFELGRQTEICRKNRNTQKHPLRCQTLCLTVFYALLCGL